MKYKQNIIGLFGVQTFNKRWIIILILVFVALQGYFIFQFPLPKLLMPNSENNYFVDEILLEKEALVESNQFLEFLLFSKNQSFVAKKEDKTITLKEDVIINSLVANNCVESNCFQHKIELDKIDSSIWKALVGIEDRRFLDHSGFDFIAFSRALFSNLKAFSFRQGGSTLTQQLVKNIYLSNEKTLKRKFLELFLAFRLEIFNSKKELIELYLNEMNWGVRQGLKVKGIFAASLFYHNKTPNELSPYEATILISLLKGPWAYDPVQRTEKLRGRVNALYKILIDQKYFSTSLAAWNSKDWENWVEELKRRDKLGHGKIIAELIQNGVKKNFYDRFVYRTLVRQKMLNYKEKHPEFRLSSIFVKFNLNGELSFSDSYGFFKDDIPQLKLQIGSLIKPFIYSYLFSNGVTPETIVSNEAIKIPLRKGYWIPKNYTKVLEETTAQESLERSLNIPTVRLSFSVGILELEKYLNNFFPLHGSIKDYPSQLLGALALTAEEITYAYYKFVKLYCENQNIGVSKVFAILSNPEDTTIKNQLKDNFGALEFFGKTGTTNFGRDSWFVFFDGKEIGTIYFGHLGPVSKNLPPLSGAKDAFNIYQGYSRLKGKLYYDATCRK